MGVVCVCARVCVFVALHAYYHLRDRGRGGRAGLGWQFFGGRGERGDGQMDLGELHIHNSDRERERESERASERASERERECVCVRERERASERESERHRDTGNDQMHQVIAA